MLENIHRGSFRSSSSIVVASSMLEKINSGDGHKRVKEEECKMGEVAAVVVR